MGMLIAYLLGILTASKPKHQPTDQVSYSSQPSFKQPPSDRPISVMCIPPAESDEEQTEKKKKRRRKTIKLWAEVVSAIVLLGYFGVTILIWCANNKAAIAAQNTLGEIQKQTTLMRQQMVGTQAAVLQFEIHDNNPGTWGLVGGIRNSGIVTATHVHYRVQITRQRFSNGSISTIGSPSIFEDTPNIIKGGGTWPDFAWPHVWSVPWIRMNPNPNIIENIWPVDWPGKDLSEIKVNLTYDNGFGDIITKDLCFERLPPLNVKIHNGSMGIGGNIPCDHFPNAIAEQRGQWDNYQH